MQVGHFPASAANSLVEGYCTDFVQLAAAFAQTLEQISMRGIDISATRGRLERIEVGMHDLAVAIRDMLARAQIAQELAEQSGGAAGEEPANDPEEQAFLEKAAAEFDPAADVAETQPETPDPFRDTAAQDPFAADLAAGDLAAGDLGAGDLGAGDLGAGGGTAAEDDDEAISLFVNSTTDPIPMPGFEDDDSFDTEPPPANDFLADFGEATMQTGPASPEAKSFEADATPAEEPKAKPRAKAKPAREPRETDLEGGLRGTSASMPILSVFQFLGRTRKTGVMTVRVDHEMLTFEFENGCIQACTSTNPGMGERLGDLLVAHGICTQQALTEMLVSDGASSGEHLGELMVRKGIATNGQLLEALELQVRRRFTRVCAAREASYEFCERAPNRTDGRIRIAPAELVFEANLD